MDQRLQEGHSTHYHNNSGSLKPYLVISMRWLKYLLCTCVVTGTCAYMYMKMRVCSTLAERAK